MADWLITRIATIPIAAIADLSMANYATLTRFVVKDSATIRLANDETPGVFANGPRAWRLHLAEGMTPEELKRRTR
jgi:hypothetical protein